MKTKKQSFPKLEHFFPKIQVDTYAQMHTSVKLSWGYRCRAYSNYWGEIQSNYWGGIYPPIRGGVEDTRLEAKDRLSRGQGPRTQTQVFSKKKKVFKNFFQAISKKMSSNIFLSRKRSSKIFFRRSLLEETKKQVFADFPQGFWRFPTKFQRFKNSAVVEPRRGQFSRT